MHKYFTSYKHMGPTAIFRRFYKSVYTKSHIVRIVINYTCYVDKADWFLYNLQLI